jgi:multicomponent K+:H+ antiporter subunit A
VFGGQVLLAQADWLPAIGLNLGLRLDGLALMFALLITGIGLLIILYAAWYLHADDPAGKFYSLLMLFMAAMLGIALSDNLLLLVVFWELTSMSSFLLVGYWGHKAEARAGARMALAVTGGGGLVMLAGVLVLGHIAGTYELSRTAAARRPASRPCAVPAGAGPDPGGLLHQERAVAVPLLAARGHGRAHAGVGLPALGHHGQGRHLPAGAAVPGAGRHGLFEGVVATVGLATMAFAAYVAVFKHDLKGLLAYSTISHLG